MYIDLSDLQWNSFQPAPEKDGKGWSYSYVYYLRDIKDVFLVLCKNRELSSASAIYEYCMAERIYSESKRDWTPRIVLEITNALKNFGFISSESLTPLCDNPFSSAINEDLTPEDCTVFKGIFFSYFRFKEFINLFYKNDGSWDGTVLSFMENSRFVNRFVREDLKKGYIIEDRHAAVMRFWDVFVKWGTVLKLLDRIMGIDVLDSAVPNISATYFVKPIPPSFSILEKIADLQLGTYIYIPEALRLIALETHYSLENLKVKIIEESIDSDVYRLQSTSAIFVPDKEKAFFPIVDNTFMSHLLKI